MSTIYTSGLADRIIKLELELGRDFSYTEIRDYLEENNINADIPTLRTAMEVIKEKLKKEDLE